MTSFIFIAVICVIILITSYLFWKVRFGNRKTEKTRTDSNNAVDSAAPAVVSSEDQSDRIQIDDNGRVFLDQEVISYAPRKTFVYGVLESKFYGSADEDSIISFTRESHYKIHLYESLITVLSCERCNVHPVGEKCSGIHNEPLGKFELGSDKITSKDWLPREILCDMKNSLGRTFKVNLMEPELSQIQIPPILHQREGAEVFGTIKAYITGFILDFIEHRTLSRVYFDSDGVLEKNNEGNSNESSNSSIFATDTATGNIQRNSNYVRREFFMSDYKSKYWGKWEYTRNSKDESNAGGCLGIVPIAILIAILGVLFFIYLPQLLLFLPLLFVPFVLSLLPSRLWVWILRTLVVALIAFVLFEGFFSKDNGNRRVAHPRAMDNYEERKYKVLDNEGLRKPTLKDNKEGNIHFEDFSSGDSLICFYREWFDSNGKKYQGNYCVNLNDLARSKSFREYSSFTIDSSNPFGAIYKGISNHDDKYLLEVYKMLADIATVNQLGARDFVNMVVSFVQDFEYGLVLDRSCDYNQYDDKFIREYLQNSEGPCSPNVRFGVYTPLEFLFYRQGDCDSRTLLAFTILRHFNFDVILMTSFYYKHSILGVGIDISGTDVHWNKERYVLWETTLPSLPAGIIADDMLNFSHWQVSLSNNY